ncbi:hypothetical protein SARC_00675 [Sphaeroforma arctica JP610]|uniref:GBD/FH3 domain-containing protein n=1 Tax=Sphaeroforma arctica JP610 TaxID=667725 RepID=A0A0L0GFY9_9EUKA|nr:hypothetical protein SARC_00675 [Sphaeroforma arctica JP610]KNC87198.1 hypothetical protein SARC_00675 [Sphaeroforma arctica JP610]|eukprot:XP_014161100.1 hypothetical protein SARC_00675 [Sphaeroforma arctica JP610]
MSNAAELDTLPAVDIPTKTTEVPIIEGELMNNTASMEASGVMGDDIDQQFTTLETIRDVDDSRNAEQETITTDTDTKPTESIESIDEYASAHSIDEYASANSVLDRGDFSQHTDTADSGDAIARDRIVHADNLAGAATIAEETEVSETSAVHSVTDEQVHQDVTDNDESAGGGVTIIQDNASEVGATGSADCSQRTDGTDKTSEIDTADDVKDVKEDTNVTNAVSGDVVSVPHGSNKGDTPGDADEKDTESIVVDVKDSMPDAEAGVGDSESVETQGSTVNDISEVAEEKDGQRVAHKTETESVKVNCKRKEEGEGNSTSKGDEVKTGVVAKVTNDRPSAMGLKGKDDKKSKKKDKKKAAKEEKEKIDKSQKKSPGSFRRFVRKLSQEKLKLATPSGSSGNSPTTTKINASTAGVTSTPTWAEQQLKGTQGMADMFANRMRQSPSINNPSGLHKEARELKQQKSKKDVTKEAALDLQDNDQENRELDIQFQRVLREMKVKPAERDAKYANMGQVQKYKMIVDYRAKKGWGDESARAYVAALDKHNDRHMLELDLSDVMLDLGAITVHLRNKPASWIMDFRKCKGLEALTAVIIKLYHIMSQNIGELDSVVIAETMHQAVRSVSMYMRIPESFDDAARNTNLLKTITKLLAEDAISDRLCADVLEFLAVVSLSGETGHAHALDALQFLKLVDKEQFRFQYVIKLLLKDSPELRVACMQMINSVTNAPHLTVDHRVHLRNEIMAAGLRGALPTLREHAAIDEQLRTHVVLWEDNSK